VSKSIKRKKKFIKIPYCKELPLPTSLIPSFYSTVFPLISAARLFNFRDFRCGDY